LLACADDSTTLEEARKAIQSHPLTAGLNHFFEASFCRLLMVHRIGMVENLLRLWQQMDSAAILKTYFPPKENRRKIANHIRLQNLAAAFESRGFNVDSGVFEKYLALKHLRNYLVHGDLSYEHKEYLEKNGYPSDLFSLGIEHSKDVIAVTAEMIKYILQTKPLSEDMASSDLPENLKQSIDRLRAGFKPQWAEVEIHNDMVLVDRASITRMWWINLEKISERLRVPSLSSDETRDLIRQSIDSWKEYLKLTIELAFIDANDIKKAKEFLGGFTGDFTNTIVDTPAEDINKNLIVASELQRFFPNVLPVTLFLNQVRPLATENESEVRNCGTFALLCWEVSYLYAKREKPLEIDSGHLSAYRQITDDWHRG